MSGWREMKIESDVHGLPGIDAFSSPIPAIRRSYFPIILKKMAGISLSQQYNLIECVSGGDGYGNIRR
jgi:hypothetical protein